MAVLHSVLDMVLGDTPTRVTGGRKVSLNGAEPFRKSAEVGGFGAKNLAPVLVQKSGHFGRVGDSFVGVRVEHSGQRVSGSRKERAHFLGDLLLPVVVNIFGAALFFFSELFNLLERVSVGKLDSKVLDLENAGQERLKTVAVRHFGNPRTGLDQRTTFIEFTFGGMSNGADTAGQLLVRGAGEDDFLAGLNFSRSFSHGVLEKVEHIELIIVMRKYFMIFDFGLKANFTVFGPFGTLGDVFRDFGAPEARSLTLLASPRKS